MTQDLKSSLDHLAESEYAEAPLTTVDITRARTDGRRRMLTSRLASAGGGVAVVAACALVVNGLGGTSPAHGPATQGPAAGHAFTGTDPLSSVGTFGYLPDGFQVATYNTGADYGSGVTARTKPPAQTGNPVTPVMFALTSSPTEPKLIGGETKQEVTVKGAKKAYIMTNPASGGGLPADLTLWWQAESGTWYALGGDYQIHGTDLQALLIKVAESVKTESTAVPLPIHIEGLPKDVTLGEAMLNDPVVVGEPGFNVGLSYRTGSNGPGTGAYFSISVSPSGTPDPLHTDHAAAKDPSNPNTQKLNLTPAKVGSPGSTSACEDSDGLHICVDDDPSNGTDALASVGGAKGLLDRITSLGTDPANWTTHVVN
jgi:hypothetical protein